MNTVVRNHHCRGYAPSTFRRNPVEPVVSRLGVQRNRTATRRVCAAAAPAAVNDVVPEGAALPVKAPTSASLLQPSVGSSTGGGSNDEQEQEFRINFGRAVRTLRVDLPLIFEQALQADIYHEQVELTSPWSWLHAKGLKAYLKLQGTLRMLASMMLRERSVELLRLWSPSHGEVRARCRIVVQGKWARWRQAFVAALKPLNLFNRPQLPKLPWLPDEPTESTTRNRRASSPSPQLQPLLDAAGVQEGELEVLGLKDNTKQQQHERGAKQQEGKDQGVWQMDVLFVYRFSARGFITRHSVEVVVPPEPTNKAIKVQGALVAAGAPTPVATTSLQRSTTSPGTALQQSVARMTSALQRPPSAANPSMETAADCFAHDEA